TANGPAGHDFGQGQDGSLEPVKVALSMIAQGNLDYDMSNRSYFSIGDARVIAGHNTGLFQLAQSQPARCRRKPILLRQCELGDPRILLNGCESTQIDGVQLQGGFHSFDPASANA